MTEEAPQTLPAAVEGRYVAAPLGNGPLVSIIIPCYNGERFIRDAIDSALGQTYAPVEVIVIDDGSTDRSLEIISSFGDRVRWETGPNYGGAAARNRGLALASGDLVQFLDADDLLHADKLTRQVGYMREEQGPTAICWGTLRPLSSWDAAYRRPYDGGDPVVFALEGILPTPAPLHRKATLLSVGGFREDLSCAQEYDLHLRLACSGVRFVQSREVLYTVRSTPGSVSSDHLQVLRQMPGIVQRAHDDLLARGQLTDGRARALAGVFARGARTWLRDGHEDHATAYFEAAVQMHPEGGLDRAYGTWSRYAVRLAGPLFVEAVSQRIRTLRRGMTRAVRGRLRAETLNDGVRGDSTSIREAAGR